MLQIGTHCVSKPSIGDLQIKTCVLQEDYLAQLAHIFNLKEASLSKHIKINIGFEVN